LADLINQKNISTSLRNI